MTTVAAIIHLALKDAGVTGEGQNASAESFADAFATLGQMVALWQADGLMVYAHKVQSLSLTGAASYSVGAGGTWAIARPAALDSAQYRSGGIDHPVTLCASMIDFERLGSASGAIPYAVRYEPTFPLGTLYVAPTGALGELRLVTRVDLPTYPDHAADINVPPEYASALRYNLAEMLTASFQTPLRPDLMELAKRTRRLLKRNNVSVPLARIGSSAAFASYEAPSVAWVAPSAPVNTVKSDPSTDSLLTAQIAALSAQIAAQDVLINRVSKYPRPARSNTSALRWHGNGGGSIGALSDSITYGVKIEAEAPYDAVALLWVNYETTAMNNCKAVAAATETFQTDTQDHRYRPMVGGTVYNALRGANAYGWDAVTWGGAASVNIPAAGGVGAPQAVLSDFMPINSVPRADGGTRPLLLWRSYHNGATDGAYTYESRNYNGSYNAATVDNRGRLIDTCSFPGDAVGTLTNSMLIGTKSFLVAPVFRYRANVVTVANVGDSISMGTGSASLLNNWNRRACYDLSTQTAPVVPMNMGFASQTSTTYLAQAKAILALAKPTIAFYFPYSPNDLISTNVRKLQDAMARCADFIDFCNSNRIIPILATPVPNGNLTAGEDVLRKSMAASILALGANLAVQVADFGAVTGNGASPEQWLAGLNADTLHPNDAGHEVMATVARTAISAAIGAY